MPELFNNKIKVCNIRLDPLCHFSGTKLTPRRTRHHSRQQPVNSRHTRWCRGTSSCSWGAPLVGNGISKRSPENSEQSNRLAEKREFRFGEQSSSTMDKSFPTKYEFAKRTRKDVTTSRDDFARQFLLPDEVFPRATNEISEPGKDTRTIHQIQGGGFRNTSRQRPA